MKNFNITTQKQLRESFWSMLNECSPELSKERRTRKKQKDYNADIRMSFCDYVENLRRDGQISESLASRATL